MMEHGNFLWPHLYKRSSSSVHPSVGPSVPCYFRTIKIAVLRFERLQMTNNNNNNNNNDDNYHKWVPTKRSHLMYPRGTCLTSFLSFLPIFLSYLHLFHFFTYPHFFSISAFLSLFFPSFFLPFVLPLSFLFFLNEQRHINAVINYRVRAHCQTIYTFAYAWKENIPRHTLSSITNVTSEIVIMSLVVGS